GILFDAAPQKDRLSENRVTAELIYNRLPYFKIFFMLCLTLGFVSLIALTAMYSMRGEVNKTRVGKLSLLAVRTCVWLLIPVALLLLSVYILRWYVSGSLPMANGFETMLTMSLISIFATLLLYRSSYIMLPMGYLAAGFSLLVAHIGQMSPQITHLMPVLNSPLLAMHVSVIMIAYALFFFTFLIAIAAQVLLWRSAETARISHLSLLSRVMLYPAVLLLCAGIFLGAIWADVSWGSYWNWDAKEVWALITLLVYAIPLHQPSFSWLQRPRNYHLFMLLAFLSVLMTYFGVNYVLGGMHSYA
ncbi:MAG: cytochrome c biogenesis protein CcsA, partial [Bacteroidaceae bacterium]|nr:cytochrome c biogenesis protein CcsA [Bacteroidaceae bacterium]